MCAMDGERGEMLRRDAILDVVASLASYLMRSHEDEVDLHEVVERIGRATDWDRVVVVSFTRDQQGQLQAATREAAWSRVDPMPPRTLPRAFTAEEQALIDRSPKDRPTLVLHEQGDLQAHALRELGLDSMLWAPILANHLPWGALLIQQVHAHNWFPGEVAAVGAAAELLGAYLHRRHMCGQIRDGEVRFTSLFRHAPIPMILYGADGRGRELNDAFLRTFSLAPHQVDPSRIDLFHHPLLSSDVVKKLQDGDVVQMEMQVDPARHVLSANGAASGGAMIFQGFFSPLPEGYVFMAVDLTTERRLAREVAEISHWERTRIGHDLHDSLCQKLSGSAFMLDALAHDLEGDAARMAGEIGGHLRSCVVECRSLAQGLAAPLVELGRLDEALAALCHDMSRMYGVECVLRERHPLSLSADVQTHLYRLAQEAIHNAVRHGKAQHVAVSLRLLDDGYNMLVVEDDGDGLGHAGVPQERLGLRIMHYRARQIGGEVTLRDGDTRGAVVTCRFPGPFPCSRHDDHKEEGNHEPHSDCG